MVTMVSPKRRGRSSPHQPKLGWISLSALAAGDFDLWTLARNLIRH